MITPLDIQNKEFRKSFMGYKSQEVDNFLDEIVSDYENLYKENIELKDKIALLTDKINHYNNLEDTLKNTLVVAQTTSDDVIGSARDKAKLIIEESESQGRKIITRAEDEVRNIKREYEYLKKEIFIFKTRYQSFIEAQLLSLNEFYNGIDLKVEDKKEVTEDNTQKTLLEEKELIDIDDMGA